MVFELEVYDVRDRVRKGIVGEQSDQWKRKQHFVGGDDQSNNCWQCY